MDKIVQVYNVLVVSDGWDQEKIGMKAFNEFIGVLVLKGIVHTVNVSERIIGEPDWCDHDLKCASKATHLERVKREDDFEFPPEEGC